MSRGRRKRNTPATPRGDANVFELRPLTPIGPEDLADLGIELEIDPDNLEGELWLIDYTDVIAEAKRRSAGQPPPPPLDPETEAAMDERFAHIAQRLQEMVDNDEPDRALTEAELAGPKKRHLSVVPDLEESAEDEAPEPSSEDDASGAQAS
jgi:hypothetical protein